MNVKRLLRDVTTAAPQCESDVVLTSHWNFTWRVQRYGGDGKRCTRHALYELNDGKFCAQHAGELALQLLIRLSESNADFARWFEESQA